MNFGDHELSRCTAMHYIINVSTFKLKFCRVSNVRTMFQYGPSNRHSASVGRRANRKPTYDNEDVKYVLLLTLLLQFLRFLERRAVEHAGMLSPACKQKILCLLFRKQATELQAAVIHSSLQAQA